MAKPRKVTEIVMSIRVAQKSPLERLLVQKAAQGVSRTVAVHQMAELLERALNEDWGPPPQPAPYMGPTPEQKRERLAAQIEAVRPLLAVQQEERVFQVSDDGLTHREVSESEALALAREQYPAGLVPVVDEGDDDERTPGEVELQDDLSHLV